MIQFLFKKSLILLLSLWVVVTGTFFLMHAIPGDPFIGDRVIPEEVMRSLYAYYGLDQPLWAQYIKYLKGLFHGDLGISMVYHGRSISHFIGEGIPHLGASRPIRAMRRHPQRDFPRDHRRHEKEPVA